MTEQPDIGKSLLNSFKDVIQNPGLSPTELYNSRMEICQKCEYWNSQRDRCMKCGCLLKAKLRFKGSRCPVGKW